MAEFDLDESSSIPIWVQLKNRFIYLITSGYYKAGEQLPTVRGLAAEIEVNYNTVSKVYQSLEADGYIVSKRRQGAFVADVSGLAGASADTAAENVTREYFRRCQELGLSLDDIDQQFCAVMREARGKVGGNAQAWEKQHKEQSGGSNVIPLERTKAANRRIS